MSHIQRINHTYIYAVKLKSDFIIIILGYYEKNPQISLFCSRQMADEFLPGV